MKQAKFAVTNCSQCGGSFGPGDAGFSHCEDHTAGARRMPKPARFEWLAEWMRQHGAADVLNADLAWSYIEATSAPHSLQMIGAPRCAQLGSDLGEMHRSGSATRKAIGIGGGLSGQGFPRWVWSYKLAHTDAQLLAIIGHGT